MKRWVHTHYHWVIAVVALLSYTVYGGVANNINSLFVLPVCEELEISRSAYSLAFSLRSMTLFLTNLFFGVIYRRYGYRKLAVLGMAGVGLGCIGMGLSGGIGLFSVCTMSLGFFVPFCDTAALTQLVGNWFHRHRGAVLGIVTAASGLGGALFSIGLNAVIERQGWRAAMIGAAALHIFMAVLIVFLVRTKPEEMNLVPLGDEEDSKAHRQKHAARRMGDWYGFSMRELRRKPAFYLTMAATFLGGVSTYSSFYTVVPHLQDCGLSSVTAATMQSTMLMMMAVTKFLYGLLSDKIGAKKVLALALVCCAVGNWLLAEVTGAGPALAASLCLAFALPITSILMPLIATDLFGSIASDMTVGLLLAMIALSGMLASPLMNIGYDLFGSYHLFLKLATVLALGALALYLVIFRMASRDRKAWEQAREAVK